MTQDRNKQTKYITQVAYYFDLSTYCFEVGTNLEQYFSSRPNGFKIIDSGVYAIYNSKEDKYYIGSSSNIANRFKQHRYGLISGWHSNSPLQESYDKYGKESIYFIPLEKVCDNKKKLEKAENKWLERLKEFGIYNIQEKAYAGYKGNRKPHPYIKEKGLTIMLTRLKKALLADELPIKEVLKHLDKFGYSIEFVKI